MKSISLALFVFIQSSAYSQCYPDRHSTNWFDAWISCVKTQNPNPANEPAHWILYDFKDHYEIDKIKIWNINDPERLNWGMKEIRIEYSTDSIVWNSAGEFSLLKADGTNRYEGMNWIDVNILEARYVLITGLSNFGGNCAGFSEIRFSAEKTDVVTSVDDPVAAGKELDVRILPNPFYEIFRAELSGDKNSEVQISINDMFGKTVYSETIPLLNGYNSLRIQTVKWPSGAYQFITRYKQEIRRIQLIKI